MKFFVVAGERSGDLHASNLIYSIKSQVPGATFKGIGGDLMAEAGADIWMHYKSLAVMGFQEVIAQAYKLLKNINDCRDEIIDYQPDAVICIDYGGFNMRLGKKLQNRGIPLIYYITPKVWAWNQSRANKIKKYFDKAYVILPFEEPFLKKYGIDAKYVGNPVLDSIKKFKPKPDFKTEYRIERDKKFVALLPGSRRQEVLYAVEILRRVASAMPDVIFAVSAVNNLQSELYESIITLPNVKLVYEDSYNMLYHADAAVVTSGTATLETALFNVPQVVVYRASSLTYQIAKKLIKVDYISLVNLIAGQEVVKELIQNQFNPDNIIAELNRIFNKSERWESIIEGYTEVRQNLGNNNASNETARQILNYLAGSIKT